MDWMNRFAVGSIAVGVVVVAVVLALNVGTVAAEDDTGPTNDNGDIVSLQTETPEEGFALALTLSRKGVTETQPDTDVLHTLRPNYSRDPDSLIAASHVAAVHFQTIAAANDYWRE